MKESILDAIKRAQERILDQGGGPEVEYMSAGKYKAIQQIADERGIDFEEARMIWGKEKLTAALRERGENPDHYEFDTDICVHGEQLVERIVARKKK